jgi:hypothetical protein
MATGIWLPQGRTDLRPYQGINLIAYPMGTPETRLWITTEFDLWS